MFRKHARLVAVAGLAGSVAAVAALDASAQERVRWKMSSAFGSAIPVLGTTGVAFSERVEQMSGGNFQIKFHEPGALVPGAKEFEPTAKGSIDAGWTTPGYHTHVFGGAVAFFTAVPFGPQIGEFQAWKLFGGGNGLAGTPRFDLAPFGIRVNSVSPGWIWTREVLKAAQMDGGGRDKWGAIWGRFHMLERCGEPLECAGPILFLLSDDASFVTGADLPVDGGYLGLGPEGLGRDTVIAGSE